MTNTPVDVVVPGPMVGVCDLPRGPRGRDGAPGGADRPATRRAYDTVGVVTGGRAGLHRDGQVIRHRPAASRVVPTDTGHGRRSAERLRAVAAAFPRPASTRDG